MIKLLKALLISFNYYKPFHLFNSPSLVDLQFDVQFLP